MTDAQLVDTHCHLDFERFEADRDAVIGCALDAGVVRIVVPAIDLMTARNALVLASRYDSVFAAVGIHPNSVPTAAPSPDTGLNELRELAAHPKVVAIGEIGLDYYWDKTIPVHQQRWLVAQLELAAELAKPVILHNREATHDLWSTLQKWVAGGLPEKLQNRAGVLHSFSADQPASHLAVEMGFFVGFTGPITYPKADQTRLVARSVPEDRILIETDAPFLAPQRHRGSRNEPAFVKYVAEKVAEVRDISFHRAAEITTRNAERLFEFGI